MVNAIGPPLMPSTAELVEGALGNSRGLIIVIQLRQCGNM